MSNDLKDYDIYASFVPKLNLSFYYNSVPVLRELTVANNGSLDIADIEIKLISNPPFFKPKTWRIELLESEQHYHIRDLDLPLDAVLLGKLTESEPALVSISMSANKEIYAVKDIHVELLARNQWGGISHMPELLSAFVTPNDPAIDRVLKKAAEVLRKNGINSALNGYEEGSKRAWELTSAIWTAIASFGLDYSLPPASFEQDGQKIRSAMHILNAGIATCLDTTLLFCSALEQCGLNPLIVITHGHAFAGVWLKPEEFSTVVIDDITALRKREKLQELIFFETTLITQNPRPKFSYAVEIAARHLSEQEEEKFKIAIDVRRARLQRIKPLSSELPDINGAEHIETHHIDSPESLFDESPDFAEDDIFFQDQKLINKDENRLDRWQRKLLDLSLRNSLLNFRATKRAIKFEAPDPAQIEDLLADGEVLKLIPQPDLMTGKDKRSLQIHEARANEDICKQHAIDALKRKEVMISLSKEDIDSRLTELYRNARLNLQEGGANTLFLAIGFLSWKKTGKHEKSYRAPLILIPVTLERKSVMSGFNLRLHDDDPRFNPTLLEMLRQDFSLELPISQEELPKDDHGLDIDGIWKTVARSVKDISGWEVIEDVVLSTFSFSKYLMWKDLMERTDELKKNPVVRHLIDTPRDTYDSGGSFPDPKRIDDEYSPENIFCPLPSDSSQLSAVIAAANGKDFVLIGPPGTGKSQTIANLISQCIAEHKTVLFVSEKIAALNVVYRRLYDIGLGDFCLELHSNKARKTEILNQLDRAWGAKGDVDAKEWEKEAQRLKNLRDHLNKYVRHLHVKRKNQLSAYTAIGIAAYGKDIPKLNFSWPSSDFHNDDDLFELKRLAEDLEINANEVGVIPKRHFSLINQTEWSPNWQNSLVKAAKELVVASEDMDKAAKAFFDVTELGDIPLDDRGRNVMNDLALVLPEAAGHDWGFVLRPDIRSVCEELKKGLHLITTYYDTINQLPRPWRGDEQLKVKHGLEQIEQHLEITKQLSVSYNSSIFELDMIQLKADLEKAEKTIWPLRSIRKRRVHSILAKATEEKKKIDLPGDIEKLAAIQRIETEINCIHGLPGSLGDIWAGIDTNPGDLLTAILFQPVLSEAVNNGIFNSNGNFEPIASGRCGACMASDLERMWALSHLRKDLDRLDHLKDKTNGLWQGLNSSTDVIEKSLVFYESLSKIILITIFTPPCLS